MKINYTSEVSAYSRNIQTSGVEKLSFEEVCLVSLSSLSATAPLSSKKCVIVRNILVATPKQTFKIFLLESY